MSLRDARLEAAAIKKLAKSGVDPLDERRKVEIVIPTFEQAAKRAHAEMIKGWKNGKHTKQGRCAASRVNDVWAMDFVHDQLATGPKLRILTVVDTFSRYATKRTIPIRTRSGPTVPRI